MVLIIITNAGKFVACLVWLQPDYSLPLIIESRFGPSQITFLVIELVLLS